MKRVCKFISVPVALFEHGDLTVYEKWVLLAIDSFCPDSGGVAIGAQAISASCGIPTREVKAALKSLHEKRAIALSVSEDGEKRIIPLLFKERYVSDPGGRTVVGDKPSDASPLPWDEIAEKWSECCPMLPAISRWSPQRRARVRACLKASSASVSDLYKAFQLVASSAFLNGSKGGHWQCTFDWLSKSANFIKVWEGNYHKEWRERRQYEAIMNGGEASQKQCDAEGFYQ